LSFSMTTKILSGVSNIRSRLTTPGWCRFWIQCYKLALREYLYSVYKESDNKCLITYVQSINMKYHLLLFFKGAFCFYSFTPIII
jgi:hypothetical protein